MADRYDEALRVLNETPAPDQWDDIQERAAAAATTEAHVVYLSGKGRRQRRAGWPVWTAAAAVVVLAVLGAMALANRDTSNVTDTGPAVQPRQAEGTTTSEPRDTTTEPDNTTGTEPEADPEEAVPPAPSSDDGPASTDPSTTTSEDVANCLDVEFRTSGAPPGMDLAQQPATPDDPRLPVEDTRPYLIGVFESSEAAGQVVHVVASGGYVDDGVTRVHVPDLEVDAEVLYPNGSSMGVAQIIVAPFPEISSCTFSFFTTGLSDDELTGFVSGLGYAH